MRHEGAGGAGMRHARDEFDTIDASSGTWSVVPVNGVPRPSLFLLTVASRHLAAQGGYETLPPVRAAGWLLISVCSWVVGVPATLKSQSKLLDSLHHPTTVHACAQNHSR